MTLFDARLPGRTVDHGTSLLLDDYAVEPLGMTVGWSSLPMGLISTGHFPAVSWSRMGTLAPWLMRLSKNNAQPRAELIASAR